MYDTAEAATEEAVKVSRRHGIPAAVMEHKLNADAANTAFGFRFHETRPVGEWFRFEDGSWGRVVRYVTG